MRASVVLLAALVLCVRASAQLAGNYTINPTIPTGGTNFAMLLDAVNVLNSGGVAGPVTFDIYDDGGPYNRRIRRPTSEPSDAALKYSTTLAIASSMPYRSWSKNP